VSKKTKRRAVHARSVAHREVARLHCCRPWSLAGPFRVQCKIDVPSSARHCLRRKLIHRASFFSNGFRPTHRHARSQPIAQSLNRNAAIFFDSIFAKAESFAPLATTVCWLLPFAINRSCNMLPYQLTLSRIGSSPDFFRLRLPFRTCFSCSIPFRSGRAFCLSYPVFCLAVSFSRWHRFKRVILFSPGSALGFGEAFFSGAGLVGEGFGDGFGAVLDDAWMRRAAGILIRFVPRRGWLNFLRRRYLAFPIVRRRFLLCLARSAVSSVRRHSNHVISCARRFSKIQPSQERNQFPGSGYANQVTFRHKRACIAFYRYSALSRYRLS